MFELKKTSADVLLWDESHSTWRPSAAFALVLGQALQYLETIDDHKVILRQHFKMPVFYPRIRIVIGRSNDWEEVRRKRVEATERPPARHRGADLRSSTHARRGS